MSKGKMTKADASRIMKAEANNNGGQVSKGTFAARAQRAADKSSNNQNKSKKS